MPFGDGTGPRGLGSMTGRGAGYCAGFGMPGFASFRPRYGRGFGRRGFPGYSPYIGRYRAPYAYRGSYYQPFMNQYNMPQYSYRYW